MILLVTLLSAVPLCAGTANLAPLRDNSIFQNSTGNSSGAGEVLFAGQSGFGSRRALLAFDLSGIPAGSTVTGVVLELNVRGAGLSASASDVYTLHRLNEDWGEGKSNAGAVAAGNGTLAQPGDATWLARFSPSPLWAVQGGDFVGAASASTPAPTFGPFSFSASAQLIADVQGWVDLPTTNFGWILRGTEATPRTARRIDSREGIVPPRLIVTFDPPAATGSGATSHLLLSRAGDGMVELNWQASCRDSDNDYAVYEGFLGSYYSHASRLCTTSGATSAVLAPNAASSYYLVVPSSGSSEGSYGVDGDGSERPVADAACAPQALAAPVCP